MEKLFNSTNPFNIIPTFFSFGKIVFIDRADKDVYREKSIILTAIFRLGVCHLVISNP